MGGFLIQTNICKLYSLLIKNYKKFSKLITNTVSLKNINCSIDLVKRKRNKSMHRVQKINKKSILNAYEKILKIRIIEEEIAQKSRENKIWSFLHLSIGQEASGLELRWEQKK